VWGSGKLADLALFLENIFTVDAWDSPKTEPVLTIVGGKIVQDGKVIPRQSWKEIGSGIRRAFDALYAPCYRAKVPS
jgi:hypothetical protein